jgi:hypothetical protein
MTKVRIAIAIIIVAAAAIVVTVNRRSESPFDSTEVSASSPDNIPTLEPIMTTESIPQPRQEGLQPPPSDVVGISKPEGAPTR